VIVRKSLHVAKKRQTVAVRYQVSRPKCTKIDLGWGSAPNSQYFTALPQTPKLKQKGLLLREGNGSRREKGGKGKQGEEWGPRVSST